MSFTIYQSEPAAITPNEACESLRVSPGALKRLVDAGQIRAVVIGRRLRIVTKSIHDFLDRHSGEALAAA